MKALQTVTCISLFIFCLCGCENIFLEPDPLNTSEQNFQIFWNDFDKYYAQFHIKNINWDSVYTASRFHITSSTTEQQLFNVMANIVQGINDMHVNLYTRFGNAGRKDLIPDSYPSMLLINPCKYIQCGSPQNSIIEYRDCKNSSIGYMIIPTFSGGGEGLNLSDERYLIIDEILSKWKEKKGIIIDLRWNTGGNGFNAETIASRFADMSHIYAQYREKVGPGKQDFSPWKNVLIEPKGSYQFLKPVVVLTSRVTSSAAEMLVLALSSFPQVTIIGDTTGGGIGAPIYRELPNGWSYRLSTRYYANAQQHIIEDAGIYPDIPVITTIADSLNGIDKILEKGIEVILNSK